MIAALAQEAQRVEHDEARHRHPVLPVLQPHLDISIDDVILSRPPSALSTHKRETMSSHHKRVSHQPHPMLVRDFLDLPDLSADPERHKARRSHGSASAPRPTSLQTLSTAFWIGTTGRSRREHIFASYVILL
jgi:hypothetical protein